MVEYSGVLLFVVLLFAALVATGIAASVSRDVACAIARIDGGAGCASLSAPPPPDANAPWNSADPVERATWGTYVSLGDSYSAGEGLGDYQAGSHVEQSQCKVGFMGHCVYHKDPKVINGCDRSGSAYNSTVSGRYGFKGGKQTWACSGATIDDVYDPNDPTCSGHGHASGKYGEGCQLDRINSDTSLVTLSIGGNDAGFADDLKTCYTNRAKLHWSHPCSDAAPGIDGKISAIGPKLEAALQAMRRRAPHARIVIVTYPRMFPEPPTGNAACVSVEHVCLTPADQEFFNQEGAKLDNEICAATAAAGVGAECINAADAFDGCEIDQPDSCLQAPSTDISGSTVVGINPGAFHPTTRGQQILGQLINQEVSHPPPR